MHVTVRGMVDDGGRVEGKRRQRRRQRRDWLRAGVRRRVDAQRLPRQLPQRRHLLRGRADHIDGRQQRRRLHPHVAVHAVLEELVGRPTNRCRWHLVQHARFQALEETAEAV